MESTIKLLKDGTLVGTPEEMLTFIQLRSLSRATRERQDRENRETLARIDQLRKEREEQERRQREEARARRERLQRIQTPIRVVPEPKMVAMSVREWNVLLVMRNHGLPIHYSHIAERLGLKTGSVAPSLSALKKKGLVSNSGGDGRWYLTKDGKTCEWDSFGGAPRVKPYTA